MVAQPVPQISAEDVDRLIRRDFPLEQFADVKAVLTEYQSGPWKVSADRVRMAVLKLSDGDLTRLRTHIEMAKRDFRDVLAYAEYPAYMRTGFGVGNLPKTEQSRIIDRDWQQYEEWLRKSER